MLNNSSNDKILSNVKCIFIKVLVPILWKIELTLFLKIILFIQKSLDFSMKKIKFIYASSASVYGLSKNSTENNNEDPLNLYAISKLMFRITFY